MTDREIELLLSGLKDNMASVREQIREGLRSVRDEVRERATGVHARLDRHERNHEGFEGRLRDVENAVSGISSAESSKRSWVGTLLAVIGIVAATLMSLAALILG